MDGMELNRLLSFGRSSSSQTIIRNLCITIVNPTIHHPHHPDSSSLYSSTGFCCFPWKMICSEISHWHHLRHLSLVTSSTLSAASSASGSIPHPQPKRKNGTVLPLRAFTTLLPRLHTLKLSGIGFVSDAEDPLPNHHPDSDFVLLEEACAAASALHAVEIHETYFLYQPTAMESSWMQCSRFIASFSKLPNLQTFIVTASTTFSRPALTLHALHSILSPSSTTIATTSHRPSSAEEEEMHHSSTCSNRNGSVLQTLHFENMTIWGGGSAVQCANAFRNNTSLQTVQLSHIVFAGDESILAGLDQNTSIQNLILTGSMLHLEAKALAKAVRQNQHLRSLVLKDARFGVDERIHTHNLCRVIRSIQYHPTLHTIHLQGTFPIMMGPGGCVGGGFYLTSDNHQACYQAILDMLQNNRIVTELLVEPDHNHNHKSNNNNNSHLHNNGGHHSNRRNTATTTSAAAVMVGETTPLSTLTSSSSYPPSSLVAHTMTTVAMIKYRVGLNQAGFWNLSQSETNLPIWIESLSKVSDNLSCTWTLLREHPLLVTAAAPHHEIPPPKGKQQSSVSLSLSPYDDDDDDNTLEMAEETHTMLISRRDINASVEMKL
jgi:hypothetical protein